MNLLPKTVSVNVIGDLNILGRLHLFANTALLQAAVASVGINLCSNFRNIELAMIDRTATLYRRGSKLI